MTVDQNAGGNNVPAVIQGALAEVQEAKTRALKILEAHQDAVSFVRPEDLETSALFIPVVSFIKPEKSDFYDPIPGVGIMAKPQLVNLICEKAGIRILRTEVTKTDEYCWVGHCYAEKLDRDGQMMPWDAEYEFDAKLRAELDAINQPGKYGTEIAKRKHLLETAKFGRQRAVTGAQFALIHKMAHVARSFKTPDELARGMIVSRVERNVNGVLKNPELRQAAIQLMTGAKTELFGPGKNVTPAPAQLEAPAEAPEEEGPDPFADMRPAEQRTEPSEADTQREVLREWLKEPLIQNHQAAKQLLEEAIANPAATVQQMEELAKRCKALQERAEKRKAGGAA